MGLGAQVGVGLDAELEAKTSEFRCSNGGSNGCVSMLKLACLRAAVGGLLC